MLLAIQAHMGIVVKETQKDNYGLQCHNASTPDCQLLHENLTNKCRRVCKYKKKVSHPRADGR